MSTRKTVGRLVVCCLAAVSSARSAVAGDLEECNAWGVSASLAYWVDGEQVYEVVDGQSLTVEVIMLVPPPQPPIIYCCLSGGQVTVTPPDGEVLVVPEMPEVCFDSPFSVMTSYVADEDDAINGALFWQVAYDSQEISGVGWFMIPITAACPADVTGDGIVGVDDLTAVLLAWGQCSRECAADVDGDGIVDLPDLMEVVLSWGLCDG